MKVADILHIALKYRTHTGQKMNQRLFCNIFIVAVVMVIAIQGFPMFNASDFLDEAEQLEGIEVDPLSVPAAYNWAQANIGSTSTANPITVNTPLSLATSTMSISAATSKIQDRPTRFTSTAVILFFNSPAATMASSVKLPLAKSTNASPITVLQAKESSAAKTSGDSRPTKPFAISPPARSRFSNHIKKKISSTASLIAIQTITPSFSNHVMEEESSTAPSTAIQTVINDTSNTSKSLGISATSGMSSMSSARCMRLTNIDESLDVPSLCNSMMTCTVSVDLSDNSMSLLTSTYSSAVNSSSWVCGNTTFSPDAMDESLSQRNLSSPVYSIYDHLFSEAGDNGNTGFNSSDSSNDELSNHGKLSSDSSASSGDPSTFEDNSASSDSSTTSKKPRPTTMGSLKISTTNHCMRKVMKSKTQIITAAVVQIFVTRQTTVIVVAQTVLNLKTGEIQTRFAQILIKTTSLEAFQKKWVSNPSWMGMDSSEFSGSSDYSDESASSYNNSLENCPWVVKKLDL